MRMKPIKETKKLGREIIVPIITYGSPESVTMEWGYELNLTVSKKFRWGIAYHRFLEKIEIIELGSGSIAGKIYASGIHQEDAVKDVIETAYNNLKSADAAFIEQKCAEYKKSHIELIDKFRRFFDEKSVSETG